MGVTDIETTGEFDKIISQNNKVIVFFWATWDGPCRSIGPVFEKYSDEDEFEDNIKFIKADIDILKDVAERLGIRALPTFISFKDGQKVNEIDVNQILDLLVVLVFGSLPGGAHNHGAARLDPGAVAAYVTKNIANNTRQQVNPDINYTTMAVKIRSATLADVPQIYAINAHYIRNTSLTFLQNPPPKAVFAAKLDEISNVRGLPYLVAVESRTSNTTDHGTSAQDLKPINHDQHGSSTENPQEEVVLGYSYLSPFRGHMLSYAPTVELSLFIHPDHQSRSLGTQLLAAVVAKAQDSNTRHCAREVTERPCGDGEDVELHDVLAGDDGEGVKIRNILAVMAIDPDGKDGGEALMAWYKKRGFIQRGRMEHIGFKKGRWLDTVYLQYTLLDQ
ncbi:hypothetical protein O988_05998 [Pseudogymnoascus sp. VKM F-3808]|nr:hypothetical protein O988_05998 [Pseudogymnoascus sp. VKM F-3808]